MTKFDDRNRGTLFRNDKKQDDRDRDYSGHLNVDGREYWLSGWVNVSQKTGRKYLGLSIKPKDAASSTTNEEDVGDL
jgi:hypothetical protein